MLDLVSVAFVSILAAQTPEPTLTIRAVKSAILAGEPLVLEVTARSTPDSDFGPEIESFSFPRVTVGPDGSTTLSRGRPKSPGVEMLAGLWVMPGEERTTFIVAGETAHLRIPGEYRMTVEYLPWEMTVKPDPRFRGGTQQSFRGQQPRIIGSEVRFTVLPFDAAALRARAEELYKLCSSPSMEDRYARPVLIEMDPRAAEPFLCKLLHQIRFIFEDELALRFRELASPAAADCLIEVVPSADAEVRGRVLTVLKDIAQKTADTALRDRILRFLTAN